MRNLRKETDWIRAAGHPSVEVGINHSGVLRTHDIFRYVQEHNLFQKQWVLYHDDGVLLIDMQRLCIDHFIVHDGTLCAVVADVFLDFFTGYRHELGAYQPANVLPR